MESTVDKRFLLLCKDKNAKIMTILSEQDAGEVMEFQTTIQMVQVVVNRLLNGKKQITIDVGQLDQIYKILGEYEQLLEQYIASGRLRRLLSSNRMRRKLEKINSELHVALKQFVEKLKELNASNNAQQHVSGQMAPANSSKHRSDSADHGRSATAGASDGVKGLKPINTISQSGVYRQEIKKKKDKSHKEKKTTGKTKKPKKPKKPKKTSGEPGTSSPETSSTDTTPTNSQPTTPKSNGNPDSGQFSGPYTAIGSVGDSQEPSGGHSVFPPPTKGKKQHASIIEVAGKTLAKEHEHLRDLSNEVIKDVEGQEMWADLFGSETFYVEWNEFVREISLALKIELSEDDKTLLKHVLDNSGTGHVSMYKWSEVLKGFGPVTDVLNNVRRILTAPWFHGFLTSREAELLLEDEPVGTYLIRFSRSSAGSFALAFVKSPKKILHILVQSCMPMGYKIVEEDGDRSKLFKTIEDIIKHYHVFLRSPFTSDLPRESWFHGDVSSQEAQELLQGQPEGTFLLRFSSQPGCFAASYVALVEEGEKKGTTEIKHALIQGLPNGYLFAGEKETFPSLKALITAYATTLKHPLPNVVDDLRPVLHRFIEARKARESGMGAHAVPAGHYSVVSEFKGA